jgi:antitoxin ParD1/3/4
MAKTTSFILGDDLDTFVREQVDSGKYASASEVVRVALEQLAEETRKEAWLLAALDEGLASGRAEEGVWDRVDAEVERRVTELRGKRRAG